MYAINDDFFFATSIISGLCFEQAAQTNQGLYFQEPLKRQHHRINGQAGSEDNGPVTQVGHVGRDTATQHVSKEHGASHVEHQATGPGLRNASTANMRQLRPHPKPLLRPLLCLRSAFVRLSGSADQRARLCLQSVYTQIRLCLIGMLPRMHAERLQLHHVQDFSRHTRAV